jgi:DAK2 domain fusion protein YloV
LIINETEKSVLRTTFLLPVLKQANVVDAGAQGLLEILVGFKKAVTNSTSFELDNKIKSTDNNKNTKKMGKDAKSNELKQKKLGLISSIKNIYCTELIVKGKNILITRLRDDIERLGDSALIVGDEKIAKIHVHTNYPQKVLNRSLKEGTLHDIQINNMIDQTREAATGTTETKEEISVEKKPYGFIAVANGEGLEQILKSIGVDFVIKGGQSMNPSTYEIVKAINNLDCDVTVILPNNKNIILTANQAKKVSKKHIEVIPTKTIPQGISAMLGFNPDLNPEENVESMQKSANYVKTGEITTAIRDANLRVGRIKKGEYIGLSDGNVRVISDDLIDSVVDLVRDMADDSTEIVTLYYGKEVTIETVKKIEEKITKYFPGIEIEFHNGGQPLYHFIFSIE